jgi:ribonuclease HI
MKSTKLIVSAGGHQSTTSNRMELTAILRVLSFCHDNAVADPIMIHTDSQYAARAITEGWLDKWVATNFKHIKNQDLWLQIYRFVCKLNVQMVWIRGHDGNVYNELADRLAKDACFYQGSIQEIANPAAVIDQKLSTHGRVV